MSSSSESDISTEVMAGVEASETAISSSEPVNGVSSSEGLKGGLKKVKEELKDEERPVPRLILPAKVYASHVANLKEEKPKRSPGTERPTRPTQVPPLVFPLANMFEERTPLPLSSSNNPSNFGAAASTTASDGPTHSPPFWDPSDSASYVAHPGLVSAFSRFHVSLARIFFFFRWLQLHWRRPWRRSRRSLRSSAPTIPFTYVARSFLLLRVGPVRVCVVLQPSLSASSPGPTFECALATPEFRAKSACRPCVAAPRSPTLVSSRSLPPTRTSAHATH